MDAAIGSLASAAVVDGWSVTDYSRYVCPSGRLSYVELSAELHTQQHLISSLYVRHAIRASHHQTAIVVPAKLHRLPSYTPSRSRGRGRP